jgi:hypothetical protein
MKFFARGAAAWLPMLVVVLVLQACGGGGSGGGNPNPAPPATPATPPPAAPSALSYTSPPTFTVGTAITALDPTVTGTVASYGVAPSLPAGLALDTTTGRVSGTPTAPAGSRAYTVTATNAGGSTTFALTFSVEQERATTDRADEKTGNQVHVMYVLPSDAPDDKLDQLGTLEGSARSWNAWLATQTGGKELRLDTHGGGKLDVTFLRLARTDAQMSVAGGNVRDKLEYALLANGFDSVDKVYLVYYVGDGDGCGRSAWPPTLHGTVAAVYIGAAAGCTSQPFQAASGAPGFLEFMGVHESLHALGLAASCAQHHTESGHVGDSPADVMYSGAQAWAPATLDVNHDDYYGSAAVPGCRDLANSAFLDPLPAGAEAPPGWPYVNLTSLGCPNEQTTTPGPAGVATQITFVNSYAPGGTSSSVVINELVLNTTSGLYVRTARVTVPYLDGAVLTTTENAVYVATAGGTCVGVVRAPASPSRYVVRS